MVLLNQWGRVAECTGACLLVVRDEQVIVPPAWEGRLESITLQIVRELCRTLGIGFVERPIDRTELYIADELSLVGTLAEIVPVSRIDQYELNDNPPVMTAIANRFWAAVRGLEPHPAIDLSVVTHSTS